MGSLNSRLQKLKSKKGFTLIELLAVIAIIAILVLIAAPSFLGSKEKAQLAHIKADVKTAELAVGRHLLDHETLAEKGEGTSKVGFPIYTHTQSEEVTPYNTRGKFEGDVNSGGTLYNVSSLIDSSLNKKGLFVANDNGEVFYLANGKSNPGSDGENVYVATDADFEWVSAGMDGTYKNKAGEQGYFRYVGTGKETVEIPHIIQDVKMTSYMAMFNGSGEDVKKVISTNKKITDMSQMFRASEAASLDLSSFDTSNVTNMQGMFSSSQATSLDLSKFDTSSVTDMKDMFYKSQATSLDLSSFNTSEVTSMESMFDESQATSLDLSKFDTSKVTNMSYMFRDSPATTLDLSSFDTSKVTDMYGMFEDSQATTGYARTQGDANRFNASSTSRPSGLDFVVKQ